MANPPQIRARCWSSADGYLPSAFESSQRVDPERTGQLGSTEIESRDGYEVFGADDSCYETRVAYFLKRSIFFVRK